MNLRTSVPFSLTMLLVSCGSPENTNSIAELSKKKNAAETQTEEENLGLSSANGFQFASAISGAKAGIEQAFGSFVRYQNAQGRRCSGFLSYDDVIDGAASVYFYTAGHCFEKRTPLGIRTLQSLTVASPTSFVRPWLEANAVSRPISTSKAEVLRYTDGKNADVVRLFQYRAPLSSIASKHLPLCYMSDWNGVQAVGYTNPRRSSTRGLVWANTTAGQGNLPPALAALVSLSSNSANFKWAGGVETSPGDSGSPVYAVKRAADGVGVDSYVCIFGIITRELWFNQGCSNGVCRMRGESIYERVRNMNFPNGKWETYAPPAQ